MKLRPFIDIVLAQKPLSSYQVILFQAKQYPLLFFTALQSQLKKQSALEIIDLEQEDSNQVFIRLETSFLGQSLIYWLKNSHLLEEKAKNRLRNYLDAYQGPHILVAFFSDEEKIIEKKNQLLVEVDSVDRDVSLALFKLYGIEKTARVDSFIAKLFTRSIQISVDHLCVLAYYVSILGSALDDFAQSWLDALIEPHSSLFSLSQHFFAKNSSLFVKEWNTVHAHYPDIFWITFFSEQLWRAAQVVRLNEQKQFAQSKSVGFRLPFSFLQYEWKKYKYEELMRAHDCLYTLDFQIKNGSDLPCFDLFFASFLNDEFLTNSRAS